MFFILFLLWTLKEFYLGIIEQIWKVMTWIGIGEILWMKLNLKLWLLKNIYVKLTKKIKFVWLLIYMAIVSPWTHSFMELTILTFWVEKKREKMLNCFPFSVVKGWSKSHTTNVTLMSVKGRKTQQGQFFQKCFHKL